MLEVGLSASDVQTILAQADPQVLSLIALVTRQTGKRLDAGVSAEPGDLLRVQVIFVALVLLLLVLVLVRVIGRSLLALASFAVVLKRREGAAVKIVDVEIADEYDVRTPARECQLLGLGVTVAVAAGAVVVAVVVEL